MQTQIYKEGTGQYVQQDKLDLIDWKLKNFRKPVKLKMSSEWLVIYEH